MLFRSCGKDTYDVDVDYLFGFNHIECTLREEGIKEMDEVELLKKQFDEVVATMRQLQNQIEQLEQKSPKF